MRGFREFIVLTVYGVKPRLSRQRFKEKSGGKRRDLKKEDSDFQLTGWPITRTRQLNLDQLIPAVHVHLCLHLESWLELAHEDEYKPFW